MMTVFASSLRSNKTMEAFQYTGPFTDYPAWAMRLFEQGKLKHGVRPHEIHLQEGVNTIDTGWDCDHILVRPDAWISREVIDGDKEQLAAISLRELQAYWYPVESDVDDHSAFFEGETKSYTVTEVRTVRVRAFQWQGSAVAVPYWIAGLLQKGARVEDRALVLGVNLTAYPGDWVLCDKDLPDATPRVVTASGFASQYQKDMVLDTGLHTARSAMSAPTADAVDPLAGLSDGDFLHRVWQIEGGPAKQAASMEEEGADK